MWFLAPPSPTPATNAKVLYVDIFAAGVTPQGIKAWKIIGQKDLAKFSLPSLFFFMLAAVCELRLPFS